MKTRKTSLKLLVYLIMLVLVVTCLFPVLWMCVISFKTVGESISGFSALRINTPTIANYERLMQLIPFWDNLYNSLFSTLFGTVTTLFFCALAGFAFAKYKFPAREALFYFVIATMMIAPEAGSIPLFIIMRKVGLINSLWSLILPRIATAVGIFYMRQYITDVPDEIVEASRIDGCSDPGIFLRIMVPLIRPAIATVAIFTYLSCWNELMFAISFISKPQWKTLTVGIMGMVGMYATNWGALGAGLVVATVPTLLIYLLMSGEIQKSFTTGALKG